MASRNENSLLLPHTGASEVMQQHSSHHERNGRSMMKDELIISSLRITDWYFKTHTE